MNQITDFFSEKQRVSCEIKNHLPLLSSFYLDHDKIIRDIKKRFAKVTKENLREYLWHNYKTCTNFNVTVVIALIKFFKVKRFFDPSMGHGDRLIGALAYGNCDYVGTDPNEKMEGVYKKIIKKLGSKERKYKTFNKPFEDLDIRGMEKSFDLVFTSPPFFDYEVYSKEKTQSVEKFPDLDDWKIGFLFPLAEKSYKLLKKGGVLALYINDYSYEEDGKRVKRKKNDK